MFLDIINIFLRTGNIAEKDTVTLSNIICGTFR